MNALLMSRLFGRPASRKTIGMDNLLVKGCSTRQLMCLEERLAVKVFCGSIKSLMLVDILLLLFLGFLV